jgi:hypothetical protein
MTCWPGSTTSARRTKSVDGVKQVAEGVHSQPTRKRRRCAWLALPDGYADFFNQHYLDYFGISAEQAQTWAWI